MTNIFDEEKYQVAADKCVAFIKRQLDVNNFRFQLSFGAEYGSWYSGDVLWGMVNGLSNAEDQVFPRYISADQYYSYDYVGQVSGSSNASGGVNVYVYRDKGYEVMTCPVSGGRWITEQTYRETYLVSDYDPETGEQIGEHEEVVEYTLPVELQEGIKMFRYSTGVSSYWEDVSVPGAEYEKAERLVYTSSGEVSDEDGGNAYPYFSDFLVRLFSYSDTEYLNDECKIWNTGSGYMWFTNHVAEGDKIAKMVQRVWRQGAFAYDVVAISGAVSNITNGRLPASFLIPTDDPQYDKDGSKAQWKFGYCLNNRTWAYDVGLALLVFTTSGDLDICREMLNRMKYEQNSDGSFNFSYDIYIGQLFEGYVRTGAMGWLLWGMCYYTLETGDRSYVNIIRKGGDWMISRQVTDTKDPRYGLMTGGIGAYNMEDYSYIDTDIEWCAVEHQCSGLQALEGCALVLKNEKYKKAAELVRDQLILKCYDKENGRFYQGINGGVPDAAWALDCTTWAGSLVFSVVQDDAAKACFSTSQSVYLTKDKRIVRNSSQEHYNQTYSDSRSFTGFKPYSDRTSDYAGAPDIIWTEGTLGYASLALVLGEEAEAKKYVDECIALQNCSGSTGGVIYVTETYASLPWEFHVWESVVSSSWLYLLIKNPDVLFPRTLRQVYYMVKITNIKDQRP